MQEKKRKIFDDDCELVNSNTILYSEFFLTEDHKTPVVLVLTTQVCFYHEPHNRHTKKGFHLCFEKMFQLMRTKVPGEEKILGKPFGIRFLSEGYESQRFYSNNVKELDKWEIECRKLMNQFNFHELFKA